MPHYKEYDRDGYISNQTLSDEELEKKLVARKAKDDEGSVESSFQTDVLKEYQYIEPVKPNTHDPVCPECQIGRKRKKFTIVGILMAIFLCPLGGICCCYYYRVEVCNNCGAVFEE